MRRLMSALTTRACPAPPSAPLLAGLAAIALAACAAALLLGGCGTSAGAAADAASSSPSASAAGSRPLAGTAAQAAEEYWRLIGAGDYEAVAAAGVPGRAAERHRRPPTTSPRRILSPSTASTRRSGGDGAVLVQVQVYSIEPDAGGASPTPWGDAGGAHALHADAARAAGRVAGAELAAPAGLSRASLRSGATLAMRRRSEPSFSKRTSTMPPPSTASTVPSPRVACSTRSPGAKYCSTTSSARSLLLLEAGDAAPVPAPRVVVAAPEPARSVESGPRDGVAGTSRRRRHPAAGSRPRLCF